MEIRILGQLEIRRRAGAALPRRRLARLLLGMLALRPNTVVSAEWVADGLWNGRPPRSAASNLRSYLTEVRRLIGHQPPGQAQIVSTPGGYQLTAEQSTLDSIRFESLAALGQADLAAGRYRPAATGLAEALALWRGPVLDGLSVPAVVEPDAMLLADRRLDVLEQSIEARLALGEHVELASELAGLVARHELRERLWQHLMLALYRSGRQGEALAAYRRLYQLLDTELGVPPNDASRSLHQQILTADSDLLVPSPEPARGIDAVTVPRQLPPDITEFVGRTAELAGLDGLVRADGPTAAVLTGTAGVGKTALAVHWAHRWADAFPDGCLYADLCGYCCAGPIGPDTALSGFVAALGLPAGPVGETPVQLRTRYRAALRGRRMLIVLDNARSTEQIDPLLPGNDTCRLIVTSRDLGCRPVTTGSIHPLRIDPLPTRQANILLRRLIGPRPDTSRVALAALAHRCERLPVALRAAAELATRPDTTVAGLTVELTDRGQRFERLDTVADLRALFSWSVQHLPPLQRRLFRLLSVHPGADFDRAAAAALAGGTDRIDAGLDQLAEAHLITPTRPGRYRMPQLLRAYAEQLAASREDQARRAALHRLFDFYLAGAVAAGHRLDPATSRPTQASPGVDLSTPDLAAGWLDAELGNLVSTAAVAAAEGAPQYPIDLSGALAPHLTGRHHTHASAIHQHAGRAAARIQDSATRAPAPPTTPATGTAAPSPQRTDLRPARWVRIPAREATTSRTAQHSAAPGLGHVRIEESLPLARWP
jgi:DNA-binding SARP family transcriptional activator